MEIGQVPSTAPERSSDVIHAEFLADDAQSLNEVALGDK